MQSLSKWAIRWSIPAEAIEDLRTEMGAIKLPIEHVIGHETEQAVQTRVRLEASRKGVILLRNNVGAAFMKNGALLRYGLANESKQMNEKFKSSDLIGVRPVRIEHIHLGQIIGQFVAREIKQEGWAFSGTKREIAQLKFLDFILAKGGDACFAASEGTL